MNFEKLNRDDVRKDYKLIKTRLNEISISKHVIEKINIEINNIKLILKNIVTIKIHGSFATIGLYKIDSDPKIDLLGIVHLKQSMFDVYENEIDSYEHFDDCFICDYNKIVYEKLFEMYKNNDEIEVEWQNQTISGNLFQDNIIISVKIDGKIYKIIYRSCLSSKKIYKLICVRNVYRRSFTLEYVRNYKILDKLLLKKLSFLFYEIYLIAKNNGYNKMKLLYMKLAILSKLQWFIQQNNIYMRTWTSSLFKMFFTKNEVVESLFTTNDFYNKNAKLITKIYRNVKFKKFNWVYHGMFPDLKNFVIEFTKYAEEHSSLRNVGVENNERSIYFIYDINAYIINQSKSKNILVHNWEKKIEDSGLKVTKKYIYPDNTDIGTFMLFAIYYHMELI
ncbi:hypothetical protein [Spiroplasma endosymbiont of Labia minor]|uniref:hypothetical protein n=1 Tax=Spiroplasma endosymbiont of Labia minor TaxID=3066305 RepID=UPI0030CC5D77